MDPKSQPAANLYPVSAESSRAIDPTLNSSTTDRDEVPHHRRGCSCWLVLLILVALFLSGLVLGYVALDRYIEKRTFGSLAAGELAEYEAWMNAPVIINPAHVQNLPPVPEAVRKEREAFFKKVDRVSQNSGDLFFPPELHGMNVFGSTSATSPTVYENLLNGRPLTTDQETTLTLRRPDISDVGVEADRLTSLPGYILNDRPAAAGWLESRHESAMKLLSVSAISEAESGRWESAINRLDTAAELVRRDPVYSISRSCSTSQRKTAHALAIRTSDTAVLHQILNVVLKHRDSLVTNINGSVNFDYLNSMALQMKADGHLKELPVRRSDYFPLKYDLPDYLQWVSTRPGDSRASQISSSDRSRMSQIGYDTVYQLLQPVDVGVLKPMVKQLTLSLSEMWYYAAFSADRDHHEFVNQLAAEYDLFSIELARRIAMLEGKPAPATPGDIAPAYLPNFPSDPFAKGPMQWSEKLSLFFSVGNDGIAGTPDDVVWDPAAEVEDEEFYGFI